jgi:hypothetical protein
MNSNYINVEWKIEKYVHICTLYMQLLSPSPHPRNYTSNLRLKFWWSLKSITWFWLWGTVWIDRTKKKETLCLQSCQKNFLLFYEDKEKQYCYWKFYAPFGFINLRNSIFKNVYAVLFENIYNRRIYST